MLRKPGKMRWAYSQPPGQAVRFRRQVALALHPDENRVEKMKLQESEDMRAPLAFLLGKLNFDKEFRNLQGQTEGADTRITAEPKTDNLPYSAVEFLVAPDSHIREVKVTGFDQSILDFTFDQERLDPPLDAKLFQFKCPKGAEMVEIRAIVGMADFVLKYADGRGQIHQQVATAGSEKELREKFSQQGFLIYSIKPRTGRRGGRVVRAVRRAQEARSREVPDLQPAVRHADPRRPADPQGTRPAGRAADRSQARARTSRPCATRSATARCSPRPSARRGFSPRCTSPRSWPARKAAA